MSRNFHPLPEPRELLSIGGDEVDPRFVDRVVAEQGVEVPDDKWIWFGNAPDWRIGWDNPNSQMEFFYSPTSGSSDLLIFGNDTSTVDVKLLDGNLEVDGTYVKLPVKTDTGDPSSPANGWMYVNTFDNKVRVYADGAWRDLATW